jgi:hypothetical protein
MATTLADLKRYLETFDLQYQSSKKHNALRIGFCCEPDETTFRDADGDPVVQVIVRVAEKGELVAVLCPQAWNIADCPHRQAVCEAMARLQASTKLIRFDLDDEGHVTPNIEIPLETAPMTADQFLRGIAGVLLAVRQFDPVIRHAMTSGEVDLDLVRDDLPEPPPEVTGLLDLAKEAGGIEGLERLLGGADGGQTRPRGGDDAVPPMQA